MLLYISFFAVGFIVNYATSYFILERIPAKRDQTDKYLFYTRLILTGKKLSAEDNEEYLSIANDIRMKHFPEFPFYLDEDNIACKFILEAFIMDEYENVAKIRDKIIKKEPISDEEKHEYFMNANEFIQRKSPSAETLTCFDDAVRTFNAAHIMT